MVVLICLSGLPQEDGAVIGEKMKWDIVINLHGVNCYGIVRTVSLFAVGI